MINSNPYQQYLNNAVNSAAPAQLTLMLYNGSIKFARQGMDAIEAGKIEDAHKAILRIQDIVNYLFATLDPAYEVSGNLSALYKYIDELLIEANLKKDPNMLQEAVALLEELRDTWGGAILKTAGGDA